MDSKLTKWLHWLGIVHDDVQQLVIHKYIFWRVGEIVNANPEIQTPSAFYDFMGHSHAVFVVMAIRRHVKIHKDSVSFKRLLWEIYEAPQVLSRAYFRGLYVGSTVEDQADEDFDQFSGPGNPHIDPSLVKADIDRLDEVGKKIEELADKRFAHYDLKEVKTPPRYNDLDDCIDLLDQLYCRYVLAFKATAQDTLMPTFQYDWEAIFRHSWIQAPET